MATIRQVTITPVAFRDPALLNRVGVHEPFALRSVIEVDCGDGVIGLGESYGDDAFLGLLRAVAPTLVGLDVFDLEIVARRVTAAVGPGTVTDNHGLTGTSSAAKTLRSVFSAFEVACLDAVGQLTGRPVVDLLGGRVREHVPFSAYLFYKWAGHPAAAPDEWGAALDADAIVRQAHRMISRYGFGSIKLKGGVLPPDEEFEAIQALAGAFPHHPLRWDPNAAWTVPTAIRIADKAAGILEYLEDPTAGIAGMAQVAREAPMPLATNMCVVGFEDIPEAVDARAIGVLLSDHHFWGGLRQTQYVAAVADTFDIGLSMHSNSHLGISLAAMVHVAASTPRLTYACDTHWPWKTEDVVAEPLEIVGGAVAVPRTPGLGVRLDRDALARLHQQYLTCGVRRRDDTGYMRRIRPDYRPGSW
ncbi:glucarate dehydratase [Longispora fulva]|uniref:glucarate dehydratase n=1 Tax=Longispora fulva TaxID=619741 RepID=A0A8J7KIE9_9ACTN|nr:glucarate dehydratase family protein [Longispora fulva]MBG6133851.1 glucarate dehydratase [Longispora fulva]GIG62891.1 glucarate dehydratase [Longispora fulva]